MTVEKPKPKQLLRPITTGADSAVNQSQFLAIICNSLKAREKSRAHGAIGIGFASHWLKNWRESFKPITKRSNRNHIIIFDSHLKTALSAAWTTSAFTFCFSNRDHVIFSENFPFVFHNLCVDTHTQKTTIRVYLNEWENRFEFSLQSIYGLFGLTEIKDGI